MAKLKRGRLWYIACKTPIPLPPRVEWARAGGGPSGKLNQIPAGVGPVFRPMKQPLYDSKTLESSGLSPKFRSLFQSEAYGEYGYYWSTDDGNEVVWRANWDSAIAFDTRDEAEARAFDVAVKFPHLIGKLIVMKLKVRLGA